MPSLVDISSDFQGCQGIVFILLINFPWEKVWPYIWTKSNPSYLRILSAKFS